MMLKVNDEFLDFNDYVEVEKRVKLFEQIDATLGDFSYSFELDKTSKNLRILGNPRPDVKDKIIYREVICDILDDAGLTVYKGYLRVERITDKIQCSFFSGNYNWIKLLSGSLSDLDLSDLDTELTDANIANSWDNETGIIFPIIDTGALITRSFYSLMIEDFTGCIFVKDVFRRIFNNTSIKLNGDLLTDPVFNTLLMSRNTKDKSDIDNRSSYVKNNNNQVVITPATSTTTDKIIFDNDTDYPYFDGSLNNYNTSTYEYTADVKMKVKIEISIKLSFSGGSISDQTYIRTFVNGVYVFSKQATVPTDEFPSLKYELNLEAGDVVDVRILTITAAGAKTVTISADSTFKITPVYIYFVSGKSLVPQWSQAKFVVNIMSLFCCICDYEPTSKTLTIDFFNNIKSKEPLNLSDFVSEQQTDYAEFISPFGKSNLLKYQDSDIDEIKEYNLSQFVEYGSGTIDVNNDFLDDTQVILESDFQSPVSYINGAFSASLERITFVNLVDNGTDEFTSVVDSFGTARFEVADDSIYRVGELVRVSESTAPSYNGEYVVSSVGSGMGFIVLRGVPFEGTTAIGKITRLQHEINNNDSVFLFINTKYNIDNVSRYSRLTDYYIGPNQYPNVGYAFFNLLNTGLPINEAYNQSLSFGSVNDTLSYQRTIIETYWRQVGGILNDPVKVSSIGNIPRVIFNRITPLRPIRITTELTDNLYYLNRVGGYNASHLPCEVDLIKLS